MKNILKSPEEAKNLGKVWKVFLAGPIQGAPEWQFTLPDLPNVLWMSPRRASYVGFDWDEQFKWETEHLLMADVVLFWIPAEKEHVSGRSYAQTTRTEFGEYLARGKKIIFGAYPEFPGRRYFEAKLGKDAHESLESCVEELKTWMKTCNHTAAEFFTSDTHFGSQRTLDLRKRPWKTIKDMDWDMIQKWNDKVHPGDIVYHLGDFGDTWPIDYLNGEIHFITGNYERDGKSEIPGGVIQHGDHLFLDSYLLVHEPSIGVGLIRDNPQVSRPVLFGHIHGSQKFKKWGTEAGIDVGVDAWNFRPVSKEEIDFFIGGIKKYYDHEAWI